MGSLMYILIAALVAISVFSVVFCILRGRGASHKKLVFSVSMLGAMAMVCFGGEAILNHFNMGWRCTPFNTMLNLCVILLIITLWQCMNELCLVENINPTLIVSGVFSMLLVILMTVILAFGYFAAFSWDDGLSYDGQMIVCANNGHGSSGSWRYYTHINGLVHGVEITQYGWRGNPPH